MARMDEADRRATRPVGTVAGTPNEDPPVGVSFPTLEDGSRSTSATGKAVLAAAAAAIDADLAERIRSGSAWHQRYASHLHELVAAELRVDGDPDRSARAGLDECYARFTFERGGNSTPLAEATSLSPRFDPDTVIVQGSGRRAPLTVPYRGQELAGDDLRRQLDTWVATDVVEPSFAQAIRRVVDHPDWLELSDHTFVVLGAGSEMGPLAPLSRWGATLALVDLPRPALWQRVLTTVREGAGRALVPVRGPVADVDDVAALARVAGADLCEELPEVAAWVRQLDGPVTVGGYAYADGAAHVRVNLAADALMGDLLASREDVTLAGLLTPTDVYAVPNAVVEASRARLERAGVLRGLARRVSGGRAFAPNYPDVVTTPGGVDHGIADAIVLQQGPNYALAKRLQRWRFRVARADGVAVSANVAPATRTRSVTKNRILAAAYAGAPRFDVEVFEPATSTVLMAALLVHDLREPSAAGQPGTVLGHPTELFAQAAAHGGLWRNPFLPRSVLPMAAVLGLPRALRG
jgi:hypothetical protein